MTLYRGGSNSIVLQYYCKVFQYFDIAISQSITISIAKFQSITIFIAKFSSIVKSIAKRIAKFKSIAKFCVAGENQLWYSLLNFDW